MAKDRRNFTGAEKLAILREHLIEKVPISEVCNRHGLQPTAFYQWQKKLFEDGTAAFDAPRGRPKRHQDAQARRSHWKTALRDLRAKGIILENLRTCYWPRE